MSILPNMPSHYPAGSVGYPPQNFGNVSQAGPGTYGSAAPSFQTGRYNEPGYQPPYGTDQRYAYSQRGKLAAPQKQSNSAIIIIVSMCVTIALITSIGLGTLFFLRSHGNGFNNSSLTSSNGPTAISTPTMAPTPVPTMAPTPTPAMTTPTPTPTAVASSTPTAVSTPTPDPGFIWCDAVCTNNGFLVEYPQNWQQGPAMNAPGIQVTNPAQSDVYAAFKAPGPSTDTASNIVANDLQTNYASEPGYTVTQPNPTTTTISGETWATSVANYQLNGQLERVTVYATVHQGKAYIIELEAPDSQFDIMNNQYFELMIGKFQFQ
jgi:hypothetical protein